MNSTTTNIRIVDYSDRWRDDFARLNLEWLERWFAVEPIDREVLGDPESHILAGGGHVLFAVDGEGRAVGTVALKHEGEGVFELTGAWDTGSVAETIALYEFDPTGLRVVDLEGGEEGLARVAIQGTLRERLDLTAFEARVRERAALEGTPVDEAHIANTLERVGSDWVEFEVDQVVELTRAAGSWRICGPAPG